MEMGFIDPRIECDPVTNEFGSSMPRLGSLGEDGVKPPQLE